MQTLYTCIELAYTWHMYTTRYRVSVPDMFHISIVFGSEL
ncbi:toxin-antitoxin system, antitoxin component, AbrB family protein [Kosakonia sp. CCTCC M2018092]|nr:toxin-antitoxin system, antitoxin component, AbrB family protein [Kosakonia sp. CCTCC M2018092]